MASVIEIEQQVMDLMAERYPGAEVYLEDVFPPDDGGWACIVSIYTNGEFQYIRTPFTVAEDGSVSLSDLSEAERVRKETDYVAFGRSPGAQRFKVEFDDDRCAVRGVVIFRPGDHQGRKYTMDWMRRAVENFARNKAQLDFLPSIIKGHHTEEQLKSGEEKPAFGHIDNLRISGDEMLADYVGLDYETFMECKQGKWPYRSLEFFASSAQILRCALLSFTPQIMSAPLRAPFSDVDIAAFATENNSERGVAITGPTGAMEVYTMPVNVEAPTVTPEKKGAPEGETVSIEQFNAANQRTARVEADLRFRDLRDAVRDMPFTPGVIQKAEQLMRFVSRHEEPVKFANAEGEEVEADASKLVTDLFGAIASAAKEGVLLKTAGEAAKAPDVLKEGDENKNMKPHEELTGDGKLRAEVFRLAAQTNNKSTDEVTDEEYSVAYFSYMNGARPQEEK